MPSLTGISQKQLEVHLKLYEGYVKFLNTLDETIADLMEDPEKNAYALGEVNRRRGFEFDGMRMHEHYFSQWEKGPAPLADAALKQAFAAQFGSYEAWEAQFKAVGMTRGIGWAILYYDPLGKRFHNAFVADHEIGQLTAPVILALDMWEHAFMVDYVPAEKKKYVDAFFVNLNWSVPEQRFNTLK